jgi:hypothetical protein
VRRLEQTGTPPAAVLADALATVEASPRGSTLIGLAAQLESVADHIDGPLLPAWLRTAPSLKDQQWRPYLDTRAKLIRHRVDQLAQTAASERPAWTAHLGPEPTDPSERENWLRHLTTIAAYRDQYQVTDDDPNHPLGPYREHGRAGHRAYWIAARSLLALRGARSNVDPSWGRLAADRFRTLDTEEQNRMATELAKRLGRDWLGDVREPAADADQPLYHEQLAAILVEGGQLDLPERVPRTTSVRGRAKQRDGRSTQPGHQPTSGIRRAQVQNGQPNTQTWHPDQRPPQQPRGPMPGR